MKHATAEDLIPIASLLDKIRRKKRISEWTFGIFYFRGKAFLHFHRDPRGQSRPRKSAQDDKWNFCLTTAIVAVNRRNHEQTTPPEPLTGL